MPEGDSIAIDAARLRPILVGEVIVSVYGTAPSVRARAHRMIGRSVTGIRTVGKHLVIDLDSGLSVHVHRGMTGRWKVIATADPAPGSARVALSTASHHACCFAAPTVEVDRTATIDAGLSRLGPDVLSEDFDSDEFVARARTRPSSAVAEVLLDQRVAAGIGNVYKSEVMFLVGVNPAETVAALSDSQLAGLAREAARLIAVNVRAGPRTTTGDRSRSRSLWVYGRAGRPCRRCGSGVEWAMLGGRTTYWCPTCQPGPGSPGEFGA